ncbi:2-hydroxyacid dehydrogenase [Desulfogranum japonicum]|uniref:2-hydroxyacid dehydrogenase n=1 Tax=Desulfogranum japonicum TaxID=231447 RepID=UPI000415134E|nr:2-hydroxyacid dehydrogenase [Desulfogranum japonicum]
MRGVFLDAESLADLDLSPLKALFSSLSIFQQTDPNQVAERIQGAEVIIVNKVRLTRELLAAQSGLRLICLVATGTDNVNCAAAHEMGISVCNAQAYGTDSVVQHVFSLMLALHTNLLVYTQAVRDGKWAMSSQFCLLDYPIHELKGKTLGIVGYGTLGKGVARIAEAFGMEISIAQRPGSTQASADRIPLPELLPKIDVLTLHCPLTEHTKNVIDKQALELMKPSAFLINAARGGIVNEHDLAEALKAGTIAGAATDVLSQEPPSEGNPLLAETIPNLIITPHNAWGSVQARQRIIDQTVENIQGFIKQKPVRIVNA